MSAHASSHKHTLYLVFRGRPSYAMQFEALICHGFFFVGNHFKIDFNNNRFLRGLFIGLKGASLHSWERHFRSLFVLSSESSVFRVCRTFRYVQLTRTGAMSIRPRSKKECYQFASRILITVRFAIVSLLAPFAAHSLAFSSLLIIFSIESISSVRPANLIQDSFSSFSFHRRHSSISISYSWLDCSDEFLGSTSGF
jgi:hypothetical protein